MFNNFQGHLYFENQIERINKFRVQNSERYITAITLKLANSS
jgi:hypothetical protein